MRKYSLADFAQVPVVHSVAEGSQVDPANIPLIEDIAADLDWHEDLTTLVRIDRPEDRSFSMMEAAYLAAERKWEDIHILSLLYHLDTKWGKYSTRRDRDELLRDILTRARAKVGYDGLDLSVPGGFLEPHSTSIMDEAEVLGFGDFLARSYPIDWYFTDLLSKGGIGLMTGWPGAGKTTLSLQMSAHAALGKKFLRWESTAPLKVLYLSLEMAAPPLHLFVEKSQTAYTTEELRTLNTNLLLAPFGVPLHIDREDGFKRLENLLVTHQPKLVVIDSLSMITPKDLTDEEAMKTLFDGLAVIRQEHGVSFLIIHHNRKKAADAQRSKGVELSDIYGSTYITAKVDFAMNVTKLEEPNQVQLTMLKNRLGVEPDPFTLIRDEMTFSDPSALSGFFGD